MRNLFDFNLVGKVRKCLNLMKTLKTIKCAQFKSYLFLLLLQLTYYLIFSTGAQGAQVV